MKKALAFFSFALFVSAAFSQNRSIEFEHGTFAEILAKAKKENKMIYVDCYTSWCGPCKWMAKNVFTNDTVADFYNKNFVNAKIDMEKGEGIGIAKKYGIRAYPTMLYLSADGEQLHRTCGSTPAKTFIASGQEALSPTTRLATLTENFRNGKPDMKVAFRYFSMVQEACMTNDEEVNTYLASLSRDQLHSREGWNLLYYFANDPNSLAFGDFEADTDYYSSVHGADSVEQKIAEAYRIALFTAVNNDDQAAFTSLKSKLNKSGNKKAAELIIASEMRNDINKKDWSAYATHASEYLEKFSGDNAGELNSVAWNFYEHIDDKAMLQKAENWSKKACGIDNNYAYNDTYAAVLFKSGKKADAKKAAQNAIEIAKKSGEDYKETATLLEKIEALR